MTDSGTQVLAHTNCILINVSAIGLQPFLVAYPEVMWVSGCVGVWVCVCVFLSI